MGRLALLGEQLACNPVYSFRSFLPVFCLFNNSGESASLSN
jgi:hypothetical protein